MDVKQTLERLTPETERLPYWDGVLRDARSSRARWAAPRIAVVGVVLAVAALFAIAPWQEGERTGIIDRALAAVGDGQVLHVVLRGEWGGTVVDLDTGRRSPAYGEREVWYDPDRDLVHQISRFGGVVEHEELYERKGADQELPSLWRHYRQALENGTARVAGEDIVDGVPVYWIIARSQMLPDVADNRNHEWAQQVAISRETFKPVAMRYTRDRQAPEGTTERILRFETLSVGESDFTSSAGSSLDGRAFREGRVPISLHDAPAVLGRTPYWLGQAHKGLPLAQVARLEVAIGAQPKRLLRGEAAAEAKKCLAGIRTRDHKRPRECRSLGYSIEGDGDKVYAHGPVEWEREQTGVILFYGTIGDDPSTYRKDSLPLFDHPYISITQTTSRDVPVRGSPMKYAPPPGSVVVTARRFGYLVVDGVHVSIEAQNEDEVIEAARALLPLNAESGAGG
jgi:hypothetical protein